MSCKTPSSCPHNIPASSPTVLHTLTQRRMEIIITSLLDSVAITDNFDVALKLQYNLK